MIERYKALISYLSNSGRVFDISKEGGATLCEPKLSDPSFFEDIWKRVEADECFKPGDMKKHERTCQVFNQYPLFAVLNSSEPDNSNRILNGEYGPIIEKNDRGKNCHRISDRLR